MFKLMFAKKKALNLDAHAHFDKKKRRVPIESNITNNMWDDYIAKESF